MLQLDLFDLEDDAPSMTLPSLEELIKPQTTVPVMDVPEPKPCRPNYRIARNDILTPHGVKHKMNANLAAIRLLKELENTSRDPSDDECRKLIRSSSILTYPPAFAAASQ